jgi:hypothetical protein
MGRTRRAQQAQAAGTQEIPFFYSYTIFAEPLPYIEVPPKYPMLLLQLYK